MKVLVIGSKGFIGKALVIYYQKRGDHVYGADVFGSDEKNYFCIKDVSDPFSEVFKNNTFDACINASGLADVSLSVKQPLLDFKLNTYNVLLLLESIRNFNPECKFLQISSAAVYGNPQVLPVNEKAQTLPLSPYGYNKLQSEFLCKEYVNLYGLKIAIARIFSAYGTGLRKQLFWDLYQKSKQKGPIELFGTGEESRDFIHIEDLVHALDKIIMNSSFTGSVYNIANGKEIKIKEAVSFFFEAMEIRPEIIFNGLTREGDPKNWKADISRLKKKGYRQTIEFPDGIKMFCEWLKKNA
ncbi:MAG: NAD-dependent epimerase/dehydratase family protein [Bacteroidetes bacterium]|nr:NAD-dependent epimerase/dehydratase family protein [Bacteroidota bacterium]